MAEKHNVYSVLTKYYDLDQGRYRERFEGVFSNELEAEETCKDLKKRYEKRTWMKNLSFETWTKELTFEKDK